MAEAIHPEHIGGDRWQVGTAFLRGVHPPEACGGPEGNDPCPFHRPTEHRMRHMPMNWRMDRNLIERLCAHGVGHPDPDHNAYWKRTNRTYESVHGCCGCCTW